MTDSDKNKKFIKAAGIIGLLEVAGGWMLYQTFMTNREYIGMTHAQATAHAKARALTLRVVDVVKKPAQSERQVGRINVQLRGDKVIKAAEY